MTETRRQILQAIRHQAKLRQQDRELQAHVHVWSPQQWWEAFQFLFITCVPPADSIHHDDLLFFVKSASSTSSNSQLMVRRKAKQLPQELQLSGQDFATVDWADSVLLNLVLQSQYHLTVVACGREALAFVAEGRTWSHDMITVTKPVFASTTITAVNLDSSRVEASNPQQCYPDICFAVDNFDNAFEELVLEGADRCYCVVLYAILDSFENTAAGGSDPGSDRFPASFNSSRQPASQASIQPQQKANNASRVADTSQAAGPEASIASSAIAEGAQAVDNSTADDGSGTWQIGTHRRTLFAGYVSYTQILDFLNSSRSNRTLFDAFWSGKSSSQQDKVVMTGPGGVGRCEVAVKKMIMIKDDMVAVNSQQAGESMNMAAATAAVSGSNSSIGRQVEVAAAAKQKGLLQIGLNRARGFAAGVQQALSDVTPDSGCVNMQCALMLLKLPVDFLARELLNAA